MINRIKIIDFNREVFEDNYHVFKVMKTDDTHIISDGNPIIYSVYFEESNLFFVLTPKDVHKNDLYKIYPDFHYFIEDVCASELSNVVLLSLLINKIPNNALEYNNLTASLYEIIENKKEQKITLNFVVTNDLLLTCHVKTFTFVNEKTVKKMTRKTQKAISEGKLSTYKENGNYIVRNKLTEKYLINRSYANLKKNTIEYFSIGEYNNKAYYLTSLINKINNDNYQFIKVAFNDVRYERVMEEKRNNNITFDTIMSKLPNNLYINVVDYCDCKKELSMLLDKVKAKYHFNTKLKQDNLNLCIVKNKDIYIKENIKDEYENKSEYIVQHLEDTNIDDVSIKQCLLELIIKYEVLNKQILTTTLPGKWDFYAYINKIAHKLEIINNKITEMTSLGISNQIQMILEEYKDKNPKIIYHEDNYLILLSTEVRLIPNYEQFIKKKKDFVIKSNEKEVNKARSRRNELFGEIIDINKFMFEGSKYLSIGEMGYGMNKSIDNSPSTRLVQENGLTIENIIELFKPNICQLNKYAITPYPFKIMNEIFKKNGGVIEDE
ncbi:MAG: hypothetical protein MJ244_02465 [Clostridia bacterium]|nr:hypothetical protein [Clostridia bacterium]